MYIYAIFEAFQTECWQALTTIAIHRYSFTFLRGTIFTFFLISIYNIPRIFFLTFFQTRYTNEEYVNLFLRYLLFNSHFFNIVIIGQKVINNFFSKL